MCLVTDSGLRLGFCMAMDAEPVTFSFEEAFGFLSLERGMNFIPKDLS